MENTVKKEAEELAKKLQERRTLLKRIIKLVLFLIVKRGEVTKERQGSSHTNKVRALQVGDFRFVLDTCHTMMGGNSIEVLYKDLEARRLDQDPKSVLYIECLDEEFPIDKCTVVRFDPGTAWQTEFNALWSMGNTRILKKIDQDRRPLKDPNTPTPAQVKRYSELQSEARRLGLKV